MESDKSDKSDTYKKEQTREDILKRIADNVKKINESYAQSEKAYSEFIKQFDLHCLTLKTRLNFCRDVVENRKLLKLRYDLADNLQGALVIERYYIHAVRLALFKQQRQDLLNEIAKTETAGLNELTILEQRAQDIVKTVAAGMVSEIKSAKTSIDKTMTLAGSYFAEIDATSELLKKAKKKEKAAEDKFKKLQEVYKNPAELSKLTGGIYATNPLLDNDFMGFDTDQKYAQWQKKDSDLMVLVEKNDLFLLEPGAKNQSSFLPRPPSISVSQAKNLSSLLILLEQKNTKREYNNQAKSPAVEFSLREYASIRRKDADRIDRGGKFVNELRRDLISGAITHFIIHSSTEKATYVNSFYGLKIPDKKSKGKWEVLFYEPYRNMILNANQYYPILLKLIQDPGTDNKKGYRFFFYQVICEHSDNANYKAFPVKIIAMLDRLKVSGKIKARQPEVFKFLCDCLTFYSVKYNAISRVTFFNNKERKRHKVITDLNKFNSWNYSGFKEQILTPIGLNDIREALISFGNNQEGIAHNPAEQKHASIEGHEIPDL